MSDFTRRDVLKTTVAAAAAGAGGSLLLPQSSFAQQAPNLKIEKGAKLRVLRWSQFVQGDIDQWMANTKKFTEKTGVEVRIDRENCPDVSPKASVAANVGSGPDIRSEAHTSDLQSLMRTSYTGCPMHNRPPYVHLRPTRHP